MKEDDGKEGKRKEWEEDEGKRRRKKGLVMEATKEMRLLSVGASCCVVVWSRVQWSGVDLGWNRELLLVGWARGVQYETGGTDRRKGSDSSKNTRCG